MREERSHANALMIILAAERPLTASGLDVALALSPYESQPFSDLDLERPEDVEQYIVKDVCGLFVVLREGTIHLVHQTARAFLLDSSPQYGLWKHSFDIQLCHRNLAAICMQFCLSLPDDVWCSYSCYVCARDCRLHSPCLGDREVYCICITNVACTLSQMLR